MWESVEPPLGTVHKHSIRPCHNPLTSLAASEALPDIAAEIYRRGIHNQIMARLKQGHAILQVIAQAREELEGIVR